MVNMSNCGSSYRAIYGQHLRQAFEYAITSGPKAEGNPSRGRPGAGRGPARSCGAVRTIRKSVYWCWSAWWRRATVALPTAYVSTLARADRDRHCKALQAGRLRPALAAGEDLFGRGHYVGHVFRRTHDNYRPRAATLSTQGTDPGLQTSNAKCLGLAAI